MLDIHGERTIIRFVTEVWGFSLKRESQVSHNPIYCTATQPSHATPTSVTGISARGAAGWL